MSISNHTDLKISIITPIFNREEFLNETIESVLNQDYSNWELILIDDGSTDKSLQIAQKFADEYPHKIFLFMHENGENRGASASRNLGIKHSSGDFITFLDSDDCFLPNTLSKGIAAFAANSEVQAVCGTLQYWFSWNAEIAKNERDFVVNLGVPTEKVYEPPALLVHNLRAGGRKPGIGCVILRGDFAKNQQLFQDDFRYVSEDQLFWAKVSLNAKIVIFEDCFLKYRQHNYSSTNLLVESGKSADDWSKFLEWLENYLTQNNIENKEIWTALKLCRQENNYKAKFAHFFNLYRRILPYHLRYKIRDFIVKWRNRGSN